MLPATPQNVLGNFNNVSVEFSAIRSRFFTNERGYWLETSNRKGELEIFPVRYTFGFQPLQQYLIDIGDGRLQAYDVAWDSRPSDAGGQRWFHLQPNEAISPEHPFFWMGFYQNWNSQCASCHSTGLEKGYQPENNQFSTTFHEVNVACEACHGPGQAHEALATSEQLSPNNTGLPSLQKRGQWQYAEGHAIAHKTAEDHSELSQIDVCGGCHARRAELIDNNHLGTFEDKYQLQTLATPLYFADGQIQDEVFVLGSFLQSKMAAQGVVCTDCHNPHSGKVAESLDDTCLQCHRIDQFQSAQHTQHRSTIQCVDCHMPQRLYMGVDWRRDHRFHRPTQETANGDYPCQQCHSDGQTNLKEALKKWPQRADQADDQRLVWALAHSTLQSGDPLEQQQALDNTQLWDITPIFTATLIDALGRNPSLAYIDRLKDWQRSSHPLVREAVAQSLKSIPLEQRWNLALPMLNDSAKSVRVALAASLINDLASLSKTQQALLQPLLNEYRQVLKSQSDRPGTQATLANIALSEGSLLTAQNHFEQALAIEPNFLPVLLNYADYYRQIGNEALGRPYLERAVKVSPESASAQHALGLSWVRSRAIGKAIPFLKAAATLPSATPRYAMVYAVALESVGRADEAIDTLITANQRWANQYDVMLTLVGYLQKYRRTDDIPAIVKALAVIAPNDTNVKQLKAMYPVDQP